MKNLKDKKVIIAGAVILLVIIILLFCFVFKGKNKENNDSNKIVKVDEQEIIKSYNVSGNDAIDIVKTIFNGDSFEFTYEINNDAKYVVTAKSKIEGDNTELKFIVDPITKSFYEE